MLRRGSSLLLVVYVVLACAGVVCRAVGSDDVVSAAEPDVGAGVAFDDVAVLRPFHLAVPVHDIAEARAFYGGLLGCPEGRSSERWIDWNLFGSQLVTHFVGSDYRAVDYYNGVDGDDVPVHHFGAVLTIPQFKELEKSLRAGNIKFIIEPHVRFEGLPGEQWTMFFKDPSGNNLEFKAMHRTDALFAKQ